MNYLQTLLQDKCNKRDKTKFALKPILREIHSFPSTFNPRRIGETLKTDPKQMLLLNNCYTTVSGHFFALCIFIFHKTEIQRVILVC